MMTKVSASLAAQYLVVFAQEHGDPLSNLKLQKLLYYAQAWALALYDEPLFDERIEAWVHGPAVPPVYGAYKEFGWKPITLDLDLLQIQVPPDVRTHLDEVYDAYGALSTYDLEKLTHSEEPWIQGRKGLPDDEPSHKTIEHEWMRQYYKARAIPADSKA